MACDLPLYGLDRRAQAIAKTRFQDKAGSTGLGTRTTQQSYRRSGYDVCELRGAVHGRYEDPYQRKHMGNERPYYPYQAATLLRKVENVQHHSAADHYMAKRNAGCRRKSERRWRQLSTWWDATSRIRSSI